MGKLFTFGQRSKKRQSEGKTIHPIKRAVYEGAQKGELKSAERSLNESLALSERMRKNRRMSSRINTPYLVQRGSVKRERRPSDMEPVSGSRSISSGNRMNTQRMVMDMVKYAKKTSKRTKIR